MENKVGGPCSGEMRHRLRNMDKWHQLEGRKEVVRIFLQKMADSGYDVSTREEVIKAACTKY